MKLEISLFKFDKNSDYLPYYTKHFLKIENELNMLDILNTINKNENILNSLIISKAFIPILLKYKNMLPNNPRLINPAE